VPSRHETRGSRPTDRRLNVSPYVECPVCGGLIEGETETEVLGLAQAHTRDAHSYTVPEGHVRQAMREDSDGE